MRVSPQTPVCHFENSSRGWYQVLFWEQFSRLIASVILKTILTVDILIFSWLISSIILRTVLAVDINSRLNNYTGNTKQFSRLISSVILRTVLAVDIKCYFENSSRGGY